MTKYFSTKKLARVFKALANERRMQIIKLLSRGLISVSDVSEKLSIHFKAASFHLLRLEREGIIERTRKGKYNYYKLTDPFKSSGIYRQIINSK